MYGEADWISTASGSERGRSVKPARYRSRFHPSMPYIDLQSALNIPVIPGPRGLLLLNTQVKKAVK